MTRAHAKDGGKLLSCAQAGHIGLLAPFMAVFPHQATRAALKDSEVAGPLCFMLLVGVSVVKSVMAEKGFCSKA